MAGTLDFFFLPRTTEFLAIAGFFWFLGFVLLAAAHWAPLLGKPAKNKFILYSIWIALFTFFVVVLSFVSFVMFPGIKKEGIGSIALILVFLIGSSAYSYFKTKRKENGEVSSQVPTP